MSKNKFKVYADDFLEWYFSDKHDNAQFVDKAKKAFGDPNNKGLVFSISLKDLFNECGYIPGRISNSGNDNDLEPEDCMLLPHTTSEEPTYQATCPKCLMKFEQELHIPSGTWCPSCKSSV